MTTRKAKAPSAAGNNIIQALALPETGNFIIVSATETADQIDVSDCAAIQVYTDSHIYIAGGADATPSDWRLGAGSYATYGVSAHSQISLRTVTGTGTVRILKA